MNQGRDVVWHLCTETLKLGSDGMRQWAWVQTDSWPWMDAFLQAADQVTEDTQDFPGSSMGKRKAFCNNMGIGRPCSLVPHLPLENNWLSDFQTRLKVTWVKGWLFTTVQPRKSMQDSKSTPENESLLLQPDGEATASWKPSEVLGSKWRQWLNFRCFWVSSVTLYGLSGEAEDWT